MIMGEYEDRYPEAFGRREETEPQPARRHFFGLRLPRQVRDSEPAIAEARRDTPIVVNISDAAARRTARPLRQAHHLERPHRPLIARTPREICDDVFERLNDSPFIDASGISISVDGIEVTLDGTINSLIAVALAQALVTNVPGVGRVQVRLRVQPRPLAAATSDEAAGSLPYKVADF
jgi:hypothetical protein